MASPSPAHHSMQPPFDPWLTSTIAGDVAAASRASSGALAARQSRRLLRLLSSAARGSRIYREILHGRDVAAVCLDELPVMRKRDLMNQFADWVTDPELDIGALHAFTADRARIADPFLGKYMVWESSGSSGEPGIFVQDASAMAVYDALEGLRRPALRLGRRLLDPWCLGERIVFIGATSGHFASTVSLERLRRLSPALSGSLHGMSFLLPVRQLVDEVQSLAPTIIATYPSVAMLLAEERNAGRLGRSPLEIWTGGEALSGGMRRFVQAAFGCPVANSYGASEFMSLASECGRGRLHLNTDWAILESVDERGRPVPAGQAGATVLLTNLANHLQPLIRYDLGDRVTLHARACDCGSQLPVIEVQGRSGDMLRLGLPGRAATRVLPLALSTVLEDDADLFDFQLVQRGPCDLLLCTGMRGEHAGMALRRARAVLSDFLHEQGATEVEIHCRSGQPARRGRSGKIQRVMVLPT
jgi:phenylacetate-CoA ligase